jgi:hypothetical protein
MTDAPTMSPTTDVMSPEHGGQTLIRQLRFLAAMAVSAAIFWHVGSWAVGAAEANGPVTLININQSVVAMAELLGLAVVAAGLAVAIRGAGSAECGALAIAVGLAALGLHGSQIDSLVLYRLGPALANEPPRDPFPTVALIAETWLWLALISVGFVVGKWVDSWHDDADRAVRPGHEHAPDVRQVLGAVAVVTLVAWAVIAYCMGGEQNPLLKGQIYFSVAMGFMIGGMMAGWLFRFRSPIWMLVAVALVATGAYLIAGPDAESLREAQARGTYLDLRSMVRPLPIEYASMGAVGALLERSAMNMLRALFGMPPGEQA